MCGIAGFIAPGGAAPEALRSAGLAMAAALAHRGPDDCGVWADALTGVTLAHRRLSVLDCSPAGHQPMVSACGAFVLAYNGEIYNHHELGRDLRQAGIVPKGNSDTEIILEAFAHWGVETVLPRLNGMFAFALWDKAKGILTMARDPLGQKPLYWSQRPNGTLLFGSELRALRAYPHGAFEISPQGVAAFFTYGYIPGNLSIYQGVHKLEPGHVLTLRPGGEPLVTSYWSLAHTATVARAQPLDCSDAEAVTHLDGVLRRVVTDHLVSDVPLGAFLSGGIDSSTVVALMRQVSAQPVRTFTIGYDNPVYDESVAAAEIARVLGTHHTELRLSAADALGIIPQLPDIYDEPFADSSQIPTFLVARLARQHVTVALSGDGGDELFAGYNRHIWAERIAARSSMLPGPLRHVLAGAAVSLSVETWDRLLGSFPGMPRMVGNKIHKVARLLGESGGDVYRSLLTVWDLGEGVVPGAAPAAWPPAFPQGLDGVERLQYLDAVGYLPDDILAKVDRATMAVSLEARVPFLDRRVVDLAWSLPRRFKLREGKGKWLLRQVLGQYVPEALFERPKMGFAVPVGRWLKGPLREWAEDLLAESSLSEHGLLDPQPIRRRWAAHLAGTEDGDQRLWTALMFQAWWRRHGRATDTPQKS